MREVATLEVTPVVPPSAQRAPWVSPTVEAVDVFATEGDVSGPLNDGIFVMS